MASDKSWKKIYDDTKMGEHNFSKEAFILSAKQIKESCQDFKRTAEKEVRILCKQDSREDRPLVFQENNLFILPKHNGEYYIIQGEGYMDIPDITTPIKEYKSHLDFELKSSQVGDSEMQHLDFAYANSLVRTFMEDPSLEGFDSFGDQLTKENGLSKSQVVEVLLAIEHQFNVALDTLSAAMSE